MNAAINKLFENYHNKIQTQPNLYQQPEYVQVVLPAELSMYSNAAAGHNGVARGKTPIGIRFHCTNPAETVAEIFASVDSLTTFIESSSANANHVIVGRRKVLVQPVKKRKHNLRKVFWSLYNKTDLDILKAKFGETAIAKAFNSNLSLHAFQMEFDLV